MDSNRAAFETARDAVDDLFRRDAGAAMADWFAADAQLLWPEEPPIIGPQAIGQAFADFAEAYETISFEPDHSLVEVVPPLAVTVGTFIEERRERSTGAVERVHGRLVHVWRADPKRGWQIMRAMTSRYAATETVAR